MAYYSGSANDMSELRSALVVACEADGWTWNSSTEVLSKGALFLRLQVVSGYLTLLGRTSPTSGDMPNIVRIGLTGPDSTNPVTFPASYEFFIFSSEVYAVINYNVDFYQWCAFGQSTVEEIPGSGMWVGATLPDKLTVNSSGPMRITPTSGGNLSSSSGALMYSTDANDRNNVTWVHSDLDGQGWWLGQTATSAPIGITQIAPLIGLLPNTWNSEAVLLPIRAYKIRPSSKLSLIADLSHARHTRVDNYEPGEIIQIGDDRWKIFPWYRKNILARDGGNGINHTGTFGWAIRYEGP